MEFTMTASANSRLATFNTLALHYQDEAYTLAFYLLGDETRAAEAAETAFARLYKRSDLRLEHFRLEVLHRVWVHCQENRRSPARGVMNDEFCQQLHALKEDERLAVVLVDVLGLGYEETGRVLNVSKKTVTKLVAQARMQLSKLSSTAH